MLLALLAISLSSAPLLERASGLHDSGKLAQAEPLYREAIAVIETELGPHHPSLIEPVNSLASLYFDLGRYTPARELAERSLALARQYGTPAQRARITANVAAAYQAIGDLDKAGSLFHEALASMPDQDSADAAFIHNNIGLLELAPDSIHRALSIWRKTLPPTHPVLALSTGNLARTYGLTGHHHEADQLWKEAIAMAEASLGPRHYLTGHMYAAWADTLSKLKEKKESKRAQRRASEILDGETSGLWRNGTIDIRALQN
jgi:tetratricopeptide (TPR) repeat protein